jgi:fucose 4-O-acetylase-like acetyltransferase
MARDPWLDNVKMVLVTFVVIGHSLTMAPGTGRNAQIYDFIYYWHIPAFVLVTGYLSRSFQWNRKYLWALFCTIVVPYFVFEFAMLQFRTHRGGEDIGAPMWANPHWPMWYLAGVFLWRLATPVLRRHWAAIPATIALSLFFPTLGDHWTYYLDLNRVVGFLPFFTMGLFLTPSLLGRVRSRAGLVVGAVLLVGLWFLAGHTDDWTQTKFLWYSFPYSYFGVSDAEGMADRVRLIALGAVAALAVLAVVPRRRTFFTDMGAATMVVYLLHGFVIRELKYREYDEWAHAQGEWTIWPTIGIAIVISLVLAWPPVSTRLNWLVDPIGEATRFRERRRRRAAVPT